MRSFLAMLALTTTGLAAEFPEFEAREIDARAGNVVYAVTVADVDGDKKPDVVALTEDALLWYRNPDWTKHEILRGKTERDNVCVQPHDVDGDGRIDFAVGAGWRPPDTTKPSTLQWVGRDDKGEWRVRPIRFDEPSIHRLRFGDVLGNGKAQLVVAPLQGRGTKGPNWGEGPGVKVLVYSIPEDPTKPDWPIEMADDSLHTAHNLQIADEDSDGRDDILIGAREGVFALRRTNPPGWRRDKLGAGETREGTSRGVSEIKLGHVAGRRPVIATIEPFHGDQVVLYEQGEAAKSPFTRSVLDPNLAWGHAVWFANLDGDEDDELIIGQRDPRKANGGAIGPGVWVYDRDLRSSVGWAKHTIDDGGMATEDAMAADLDGDGRPEIIAGGRATHNVKIYWNKSGGKGP